MAILLIDPVGSRTWAFRDALLLATAGAMAARNTPHFFRVFSKENANLRTHGASDRTRTTRGRVRAVDGERVLPSGRTTGELAASGNGVAVRHIGIGATMGLFVYLALTASIGSAIHGGTVGVDCVHGGHGQFSASLTAGGLRDCRRDHGESGRQMADQMSRVSNGWSGPCTSCSWCWPEHCGIRRSGRAGC
jgi:hypothetical protein